MRFHLNDRVDGRESGARPAGRAATASDETYGQPSAHDDTARTGRRFPGTEALR